MGREIDNNAIDRDDVVPIFQYLPRYIERFIDWNFRKGKRFRFLKFPSPLLVEVITIRGVGRKENKRERKEKRMEKGKKKTMRIHVLAIKFLRVVKSYSLAFHGLRRVS